MAHEHIIRDSDLHFVIDPVNRTITNNGAKISIMQFDHKSERLTFELPRWIEGHDMALTDEVMVLYDNTSNGTSKGARTTNTGFERLTDLTLLEDEETLTVSWLIAKDSTQLAGTLGFQLRFACYGSNEVEEYTWHTDKFSAINVSASYNAIGSIVETYPDVIDDIYERLANLEYKPIEIITFAADKTVFELGYVDNQLRLNWTLNKSPASIAINGIEIDNNGDNSGTIDFINEGYERDTQFTLVVTDERGATDTATFVTRFYNGIYYGCSTVDAVTDVFDDASILSMTKTLSDAKARTFSVNAAVGEYIYYCLPARLGICEFSVGGFAGGFSRIDSFEFTNTYGYVEDYDIYRSDNPGLGTVTATVK